MPRREPDGDTGVEVAIDRIRDMERELEELKAFVAGKLPHDHDGRYVNESGDTMAGNLLVDAIIAAVNSGELRIMSDGTVALGGAGLRGHLTATNDQSALWRQYDDNGTERGRIYFANHLSPPRVRIDKYDSSGTLQAQIQLDDNDLVTVVGDFDVTGAKNAQIDPEDPDNPNLRYRFAAVEADEPGLLIHRRTATIPEGNGGEATVDLPAHWSRIAKDGDAMVTPLNDTRDQAPAAAVVDLTVPEVTVRGKPGDYRVWVCAARADAGVDGWTHEVEVSPDDEDV